MLRRRLHPLAATLLLLVTAGAVGAQTPQEIFDRFTKAVDPDGRIASFEGLSAKGTFSMPAAGMNATFTQLQRRPNQGVISIVIDGLGEMKQGFDGTTAWASDPMQGPRIVTGPEAAAFMDGADVRTMIRGADLFSAAELAGESVLDGEKCVRVKLTWKSSRVSTECYSVTTGLILESRGVQASPQGEIETVSRLSDYRPVGGILMPYRVVVSTMGAEQILQFTEVVAGAQDAKLFELPPEIKALKDR